MTPITGTPNVKFDIVKLDTFRPHSVDITKQTEVAIGPMKTINAQSSGLQWISRGHPSYLMASNSIGIVANNICQGASASGDRCH